MDLAQIKQTRHRGASIYDVRTEGGGGSENTPILWTNSTYNSDKGGSKNHKMLLTSYMEAPQTACLAGAQNLNATPGQLCNLARRLDPGSQTNRASKPTVKVKATCTCARVGMCLRKICDVHRLHTVLIGYYDYHLMTNI